MIDDFLCQPFRVTVPISLKETDYLLRMAHERTPMSFVFEGVQYHDMVIVTLTDHEVVFQRVQAVQ